MPQPQSSGDSAGTATLARHRVRDGIQQLILSGHYQPGQRLVQQELAARFGVAQSVVRESLLELQFCGLVQAIDNLGMFVTGLDAQTLLDAYQIREMLEGLAARLCCENASRADVRVLHDLARSIQDLGHGGDYQTMTSLDREFHYRMILASQNQLLARLTEAYRVLGMFIRANRDIDQVHDEHVQIVAAVEANQPDQAEILARQHVRAARQSIERQAADGTFLPCAAEAAGERPEEDRVATSSSVGTQRKSSRKRGNP